jgi:hypothetical protein
LNVTYSVTPTFERTAYQEILPSFAYPPALLDHFGSSHKVAQMLDHIGQTYLSTKYQATRDWVTFLRDNATADTLECWVHEFLDRHRVEEIGNTKLTADSSVIEVLQRLFVENGEAVKGERDKLTQQVQQLAESLLSVCLEIFSDELKISGLPSTMEEIACMTPYELSRSLFERYRSEGELANAINRQVHSNLRDFLQFGIRVLLYRFGVKLDPRYRFLFISP